MRLLSWPWRSSALQTTRSSRRLSSLRSDFSSGEDSDDDLDHLSSRRPGRRKGGFEWSFAWTPIPHLRYSSDDPVVLSQPRKWIAGDRNRRTALPLHESSSVTRPSETHHVGSLANIEHLYTLGAWIMTASMAAALALLMLQALLTAKALLGISDRTPANLQKRSLPTDLEGSGAGPIEALVGLPAPRESVVPAHALRTKIPGVTLPASHAAPLLAALLACQLFHELGHCLSAAVDGITPTRMSFDLHVIIPSAHVGFPSSVADLSP